MSTTPPEAPPLPPPATTTSGEFRLRETHEIKNYILKILAGLRAAPFQLFFPLPFPFVDFVPVTLLVKKDIASQGLDSAYLVYHSVRSPSCKRMLSLSLHKLTVLRGRFRRHKFSTVTKGSGVLESCFYLGLDVISLVQYLLLSQHSKGVFHNSKNLLFFVQ